MTLYACMKHSPMHIFGKGYVCAVCHQPIVADIEFAPPAGVSPETQSELDAIDANIRNAAIKAKDTWLD